MLTLVFLYKINRTLSKFDIAKPSFNLLRPFSLKSSMSMMLIYSDA